MRRIRTVNTNTNVKRLRLRAPKIKAGKDVNIKYDGIDVKPTFSK